MIVSNSNDFDPYHEWLAIPKDQRPPTHFQILGVSPSEQNPKVIEMAAVRQSAFIRTLQAGSNGEHASKILTEIADARATLADPVRRKQYEAELALRFKPNPQVEVEAQSRSPSRISKSKAVEVAEVEEVRIVSTDRKPRPKARASNNSDTGLIKLMIGIGGVVVVVIAAIFVIRGMRRSDDVAVKPQLPPAVKETNREKSVPATELPKKDVPSPVPKKGEDQSSKDLPKSESMNRSDPPIDPKQETKKEPVKETPQLNIPPERLLTYTGPEPHKARRTGIVVSADGLFLTTNSFVAENPNGNFIAVGANAYRATVVKQSEELDLALLQLEGASELPTLSFASAPVKSGAKLEVFGFKNAGPKCAAQKEVAAKVADDKGKIQISGSLSSSAVGGPIVNEKGFVVGIVGLRGLDSSTRVAVFIPSADIVKWAEGTSLQTSIQAAGDHESTADEGMDVKKSVGLAVGRSNRSYKKFTDSITKLDRGVRINGIEVENDEHNVLLIDEAIETLSNVQPGDMERAVMYFLPKCRPNYRKQEVCSLIERHLKVEANRGRALLAFARFADNAYDRLKKDRKNANHFELDEALAITGDPRYLKDLVKQLSSKNGRRSFWFSRDLAAFGEEGEDAILEVYRKTTGVESRKEIIGFLGQVGGEKTIEELRKIAPVGRKRVFDSIGDHAENAINSIERRLKRGSRNADNNKIDSDFSIDYDASLPKRKSTKESEDSSDDSESKDSD